MCSFEKRRGRFFFPFRCCCFSFSLSSLLSLCSLRSSLFPEKARTGGVGPEAPDLLREVFVPPEVLREHLGPRLGVVARADLAVVDRLGEAVLHRPRLQVDPVVLVGRLGHHDVVRGGRDGLAEGDDRVRDADLGAA